MSGWAETKEISDFLDPTTSNFDQKCLGGQKLRKFQLF